MERTNKVVCRNIVCKAKPFTIEYDQTTDLNKIKCLECGHVGVMWPDEFVTAEEIVQQISEWRNKVLYKNAFKYINYKKLPKTISQQQKRRKNKGLVKKPTPVRIARRR